MCEKHKQVVIYFDAKDKSNFKKITDEDFKSYVKINLKLNRDI